MTLDEMTELCPPPTTVAVHEAADGPVFLCLCPAAAVVGLEVEL